MKASTSVKIVMLSFAYASILLWKFGLLFERGGGQAHDPPQEQAYKITQGMDRSRAKQPCLETENRPEIHNLQRY